MVEQGFREALTIRQKTHNTLLCVGLDPLIENLPDIVRKSSPHLWTAVFLWMKGVVDASAASASMFKPQRAHWEAIPGGIDALRALIAHIRSNYPDIPVFLDCKRGDIDRTQQQYREAHFTLDGVSGMNYNQYMGRDTLKSLVDREHLGRALVGLGRTSNPAAWEIQDQYLADGTQLWEFMVDRIAAWSHELGVIENAGVVMGAAHKNPDDPVKIYSWHLIRAREIVGDTLWFLIPGIGTQGGFIEETIGAAFMGAGTVAVNASSAINFASSGSDFAEAAGREAEKLCYQMRAAGGNC